MYCSVPYWKIVFSLFKYPRHSVSFDTKRYLSRYKNTDKDCIQVSNKKQGL